MKRRGLLVVIVLLLLAVVGWLGYSHVHGRSKSATAGAKGSAAAVRGDSGVRARSAMDTAEIPTWFAQYGVAKRRVAGKVVHAGQPVAGAIVRLAIDIVTLQPVVETKSGADGSFDFGPQPAVSFDVSAEAPNLTSASVHLELADPKAKPEQIVLALTDCKSRLFGSVLDASGGGIAKARLLAAGLAGTESDGSGKYSLCVAENQANVRVYADGYGAIQVNVHLFGELPYDFVLVPETVLVGQVITRDKRPVQGARVIATPDPSEGPHHLADGWAISDEDGRFRVAGLSPGHYQLFAAADNLLSTAFVDAIASAGTSTHDAIIILDATAHVSGHVMMSDKPVEGARVMAPVLNAATFAYSQEDGSFALDHVPFGTTHLGAAPYEVKAPKSVEVKAAKVEGVTLDVVAMASLHGRVLRKGKPVVGAEVSTTQRGQPVKSDEAGEYVLEGLNPGVVTYTAWDVPGRAFALQHQQTLAAGESKRVDIELDRAGSAKGVVVDEMSKPVPGVYVHLISEDGTFDQGESMTNAKGEFDCGSMSGGDYRANVYPSPMAGQAFAPASGDRFPPIKVPLDGDVTAITLAIKHDVLSIKGTITDDVGGPVADVHVEAIGQGNGGFDLPSIMSTAGGTFEIKNLAPGTYALHAHASDGSEAELQNIAAGAEGVAIKLIRPGSVDGTFDGFTQTPAITMRMLTANLLIGNNPIIDGNRFWQTGVRPGHYAIEAKAGLELDGATVDIKSGETAHVALHNRGTGKVEGHVSDFVSKAPLAGFQCDANLSMGGQMGGPPADPSQTGYSDDKGHFAMAAPLGKVRVFCFMASDASRSVAGVDIDVTSQAPAQAEVLSVKNTAGASQGDAGFRIRPIVLPLVVNAVDPAGPAAAQGLQVGDVVVSLDGAPLQGVLPMGVLYLLGNHKPGSTVTVGVTRAGTAMTFKIPVRAAAQ